MEEKITLTKEELKSIIETAFYNGQYYDDHFESVADSMYNLYNKYSIEPPEEISMGHALWNRD